MNIIEEVLKEIHPEWDLYTKSRYLYLKSCEYFCYDHRYYYANRELLEKIKNRSIYLGEVQDFRVICGSWSREVYLELLKLIGIHGVIEGVGRGHQYVSFTIDDMEMVADACGDSDLTRVKMGNNTYGFYSKCKYQDRHMLEEADQKIGYLNFEYSGIQIKKEAEQLQTEFENERVQSRLLTYDEDFFLFKMYKIQQMLENYPLIKSFSDCQFAIDYLGRYLFNDFDYQHLSKYDLYNPDLDDGDFMRIFQLCTTYQDYYFSLMNMEEGYEFYEITGRNMKQYTIGHQIYKVR